MKAAAKPITVMEHTVSKTRKATGRVAKYFTESLRKLELSDFDPELHDNNKSEFSITCINCARLRSTEAVYRGLPRRLIWICL
jgi:hypothetical protein